jgi:type IV pilus assembly protein PilQ
VGQNTNNGPAINTNTVTTQVQVENGGTVVLGGIYSSTESNQTDKVPLLGDIPVLGYLFKTNSKSVQKDELMVFLTPRIVTSADLAR